MCAHTGRSSWVDWLSKHAFQSQKRRRWKKVCILEKCVVWFVGKEDEEEEEKDNAGSRDYEKKTKPEVNRLTKTSERKQIA